MGLLHSRPRPQWRFKMSVNVCSDGIFWTTEHFVTKLGTVMQYYEPECCAEKLVHCLQCQGHSEGLNTSKILLCPLYLLNCRSVCYQTWFGSIASKAGVSCRKMGLLCSRSRSQWKFKMSVNVFLDDVFSVCPIISVHYLLNHSTIFLPNWIWWCIIMKQCIMQKNWFTIFSVKVTARAYIIKIWL